MFTIIFCFAYLILLSLCDLFWKKIPNAMLMAFFVSVFCSDISFVYGTIIFRLLSALVFFGIFFLIAFFTNGLGAGDAKLAGVLGYCNGLFRASLILGLASVFGILFFIIHSAFRKKIKTIPFAPFVLAAFFVYVMLAGRINEIL